MSLKMWNSGVNITDLTLWSRPVHGGQLDFANRTDWECLVRLNRPGQVALSGKLSDDVRTKVHSYAKEQQPDQIST